MAAPKMSIDISEQENSNSDQDGVLTPYGDFVEEFNDKVAIQRILSGAHSIGRNEACLMLAQFRGCNIDAIPMNDPAVLMLDGTAVAELEDFLNAGGSPLEDAIRGPQVDELMLTTQGRNSEKMQQKGIYTLTQLRQSLNSLQSATDPEEQTFARNEFWKYYGGLNPIAMNKIPEQTHESLTSIQGLEPAQQDMVLMSLTIPTLDTDEKQQEARISSRLHPQSAGLEGTEGYNTNTGTAFGERYRRSYGHDGDTTVDIQRFNTNRSKVVSVQRKNLREWLFGHAGSQHVWFFVAGFFLFWIFFFQIWVDFAYGKMWRAVLMEFLCLASVLMMMMEADTEFIRLQIQERLYNYYQFLSTIEGRTTFYTFLCFLAFGEFSMIDAGAVVGGMILLLLTVTRFVLYQLSETCIDDYIITWSHDSQQIRERFHALDSEKKGYLTLKDIDNMIDPNFVKCCCCRGWLKEIVFWRMDNETNDGKIDRNEFVQFCLKFGQNQEVRRERAESKRVLIAQAQSIH